MNPNSLPIGSQTLFCLQSDYVGDRLLSPGLRQALSLHTQIIGTAPLFLRPSSQNWVQGSILTLFELLRQSVLMEGGVHLLIRAGLVCMYIRSNGQYYQSESRI